MLLSSALNTQHLRGKNMILYNAKNMTRADYWLPVINEVTHTVSMSKISVIVIPNWNDSLLLDLIPPNHHQYCTTSCYFFSNFHAILSEWEHCKYLLPQYLLGNFPNSPVNLFHNFAVYLKWHTYMCIYVHTNISKTPRAYRRRIASAATSCLDF